MTVAEGGRDNEKATLLVGGTALNHVMDWQERTNDWEESRIGDIDNKGNDGGPKGGCVRKSLILGQVVELKSCAGLIRVAAVACRHSGGN